MPAVEPSRELVVKLPSMLDDPKVWAVDPIGHTPRQLREIVVKGDYRQCVRELWSRAEAWMGNRYQHDKLLAEIGLLEVEHEELGSARRGWMEWLRPSRALRKARQGLLEVEMRIKRKQVERLNIEAERVIMRETAILYAEFQRLTPEEGKGI